MKVKSFIEWCTENTTKAYGGLTHYDLYLKVLDLYNQKFTVDFLVNPYRENVTEEPKDIEKYQQSEQSRLFEGWEYNTSGEIYELKNYECAVEKCIDGNFYFVAELEWDTNAPINTLNDFITLCQLAGIELIWNPNNDKVKSLNL